jgi:ATP-binding cassette, subfamily B, bacterial PglK
VLDIMRKLKTLLSRQEKIHLAMLACLVCAAAIFETLGVASILPYMSLLTMPDSELSQRVFDYATHLTGETARDQLVVYVGCAVLVGVVFGSLLSGLSTWYALRFSMIRIHAMSQRILVSYLGRDYEFFIQRNSSTLLKNLLSEVGNVVGGVMTPLIQMSTRIIVVVLLTFLLFFVNFKVAAISVGVFLGIYVSIYIFTRHTLSRMGAESVAANDARYQTLTELFSGIREVKLWNKEKYYFSLFSRASEHFADMNSRSQLIALVPRYALEILAFGGMVIVTIVLASTGKNFSNYIPLLSLYAAAGYKLLPSLQQVFVNLSAIRFSAASLNALVEESKTWLLADASLQQAVLKCPERHLNREIRFEDVTYCYPGSDEAAVGPLNLNIPAFCTTGIVGASGAGKSTLLDLMLGLLQPSSGCIFIDDQVLDAVSRQNWAAVVGYVPQSIYLTDGTVAENIAFGTPSGDIDLVAAAAAARAAQVYDVIDALPEKFQTRLGERGLRLSGGQRQRIAIARALYRNPEILIFDEATSALDSETEEAVMEAVRSLAHQRTIVIVTHRHSTLRDCEWIYSLEGGKLVKAGSVPSPSAGAEQSST